MNKSRSFLETKKDRRSRFELYEIWGLCYIIEKESQDFCFSSNKEAQKMGCLFSEAISTEALVQVGFSAGGLAQVWPDPVMRLTPL